MKKLMSYFLVAFLFLAISADAKEKQGNEEGTGSSTKSSGVNTGVSPEQPGQFGIESSSCTWWWLSGQHSWSWSGNLYISWNSYGKTWTEYGTSTGPCSGVPLIVDRIYIRVVEYPRGSAYADYDNTAYNTNFVDRGNSGWCVGCPNLCGAWSYHEATKSGITWSAQARSGCV